MQGYRLSTPSLDYAARMDHRAPSAEEQIERLKRKVRKHMRRYSRCTCPSKAQWLRDEVIACRAKIDYLRKIVEARKPRKYTSHAEVTGDWKAIQASERAARQAAIARQLDQRMAG